jgi:multidrug efflux system membrane fusion protein
MSIASKLYARPWLLAGLVAGAVVLWLASGSLGGRKAGEGRQGADDAQPDSAAATPVQVRTQQAEPVTRFISVFGRTAPARIVDIKAETSGRVEALDAARGQQVRKGAVMVRLDLRDRQARLEQTQASVAQHQTAYEGQLELKAKGYVSDTQIAETFAKLETARADLVRAELDLEYMLIRAPFDGVIQERPVELGDYVRAGDPVLTFVDNTRLIVTASIAEQDARYVTVNNEALAKLVTGQQVRGRIRFIAPVADEATRTFTVELEVPNAGGKLPSGVTAEMQIPAGEMLAQKVSPAILSLAADGQIGVMTVAQDNRAVFTPVEIARSEPDGLWVTGLPASANIITVGQGYVSAGQIVAPVFGQQDTALAAEQDRKGTLK